IKERVAAPRSLASTFGEPLAERPVRGRILEITLEVEHPLANPFPVRTVVRAVGIFPHARVEPLAEGLVVLIRASDAYDREIFGKQLLAVKIVERGKKQPLREVSTRAKNDERAGRRRFNAVGHVTRPP